MDDTGLILPPATSGKKQRVCAYCRVSTSRDSQTDSYDIQIAYYTDLIHNHPQWTFAGIYADEGVSGTSLKNRNNFNRMLKDCGEGLIDRIIVKSITRFARNTVDCISAVRKLKDLGVSIYFENERMDTGNLKAEVLLTMFSAIAQEESTLKSHNNKWRTDKNFQSGAYVQSTMPYGYMAENGSKFIPQEEQAHTVRRIFKEYLRGQGLSAIAEMLNMEGVPSPKNKRWTETQVGSILKNERYTGDMLLQKWYTNDAFQRKRNRGEQNQYYVKNNHPPLIDRASFNKVQTLLSLAPKPSHPARNATKAVQIKCSICGGSYIRKVRSNTTAWYCSKNKGACTNRSIPENKLTGAFYQMIRKLNYGNNMILNHLYSDYKKLTVAPHQTDPAIAKKQQALLKQMQFLSLLWANDDGDSQYMMEQRDSLNKELNALTHPKAAKKNTSGKESPIAKTRLLLNILSDKNAYLENQTLTNGMFHSVVTHITVNPDQTVGFYLLNGLYLTERTDIL